MDLEAMSAAVLKAADRARSGGGPTFIEAMTYRFSGHMSGDMQTYRSDEEVAEWRKRDPLVVAQVSLAGLGVSDVDAVFEEAKTDVRRAESLAFAAREPAVEDIGLGAPRWQTEERVARVIEAQGGSV